MTEKEFVARFQAEIRGDRAFADIAISLAKEAGAKFERRMVELPELGYWTKGNDGKVIDTPSLSGLTLDEASEVLRRCKAVERGVRYLEEIEEHVGVGITHKFHDKLRAILEGVE